ncbi:MAG: hypothetical protein IT337_15560, partial [Thermomicrobiales bacterium]|nr:hypothetical protein [Thermomicrobiales bacterium]
FMGLILLGSVVEEFNERAALWDEAFAAGADNEKLQVLYKNLQTSHWDYRDAHANVMELLWQLGPPLPLVDQDEESTFRAKIMAEFDLRSSKRVRQAWVDYKNRREEPLA